MSKTVKCRVLNDNQFGKMNDIVELSEEAAAQGLAQALVDPHPSAVKEAKAFQAAAKKAEKAEQAEG